MNFRDFTSNFTKAFIETTGLNTDWHVWVSDDEMNSKAYAFVKTAWGTSMMSLNFDQGNGLFWCQCDPCDESFSEEKAYRMLEYANSINLKGSKWLVAMVVPDSWSSEFHIDSVAWDINFVFANMPGANIGLAYSLQLRSALNFFRMIINDTLDIEDDVRAVIDISLEEESDEDF